MIVIFIRALILYIFVLISLRLMGKGELAEMQPFELVVILMIAELAALPMEDLGVPLINGFVSITTLIFAQVIISYINLKSQRARAIICGKPSILIAKGQINEKELQRLRVNINDLVEQVRSKGYPLIDDIQYAILETNGDLSVLPKDTKRPPTTEELNIEPKDGGLPLSIIIDGNVNYSNLKQLQLDENWLRRHLKHYSINDPKDVLFAYVDQNKQIYVHNKHK